MLMFSYDVAINANILTWSHLKCSEALENVRSNQYWSGIIYLSYQFVDL